MSVCRRFGTKCAGCAQGISPSDLVRKARSKVFHLNCFTCMVCNKQLSTGEELYVIDENKFVCKDDYLSSSSLKEGSLNSGRRPSPLPGPGPSALPTLPRVQSSPLNRQGTRRGRGGLVKRGSVGSQPLRILPAPALPLPSSNSCTSGPPPPIWSRAVSPFRVFSAPASF